jgi:protein phosphatase
MSEGFCVGGNYGCTMARVSNGWMLMSDSDDTPALVPRPVARLQIRGWGIALASPHRAHSEDAIVCRNDIGLFAVAGGVSSHLGGGGASSVATRLLEQLVTEGRPSIGAPSAILEHAIVEANQLIHQLAQAGRHLRGMGTTLTVLYFSGSVVHVGHVGDSRAYLIRNGRANQLTRDHSWLAEQVRAGIIADADVENRRGRHVLTRCLGFSSAVDAQLAQRQVCPGDRFLLCSDGLWNHVSSAEMAAEVNKLPCSDVPRSLAHAAFRRAGKDDVSCIAIETVSGG